jgi:hypothetical protein
MSKKKKYGAWFGAGGALIPLLTMAVRFWLERRAGRRERDTGERFDPPGGARRRPASQGEYV